MLSGSSFRLNPKTVEVTDVRWDRMDFVVFIDCLLIDSVSFLSYIIYKGVYNGVQWENYHCK